MSRSCLLIPTQQPKKTTPEIKTIAMQFLVAEEVEIHSAERVCSFYFSVWFTVGRAAVCRQFRTLILTPGTRSWQEVLHELGIRKIRILHVL